MGAKLSVLGLIMSFPPYLRSAMIRFPFEFSSFVIIWGFEFLSQSEFLSLVTILRTIKRKRKKVTDFFVTTVATFTTVATVTTVTTPEVFIPVCFQVRLVSNLSL